MANKNDGITVRQAAAMMPAGPDREALHTRARGYFEENGGPWLEKRIAGAQRAMELIWAAQEAQLTALRAPGAVAEAPKSLREQLRLENQLDRLARSLEALWETAFRFAREAIFRETRKRLATPVSEVREGMFDYKSRRDYELKYAQERDDYDAKFAQAMAQIDRQNEQGRHQRAMQAGKVAQVPQKAEPGKAA
jgi:uncharacterized coiled-coil DUF342 family protein